MVSKFIVFMDFTLALIYLGEIPPNLVVIFKGVDAHIPVRNAQELSVNVFVYFIWYIFVNYSPLHL